MTHISDIAQIRSGSPFRERIIHETTGKYRVVQGKDLGSDGLLSLENMARVGNAPGRAPPDVLSAGDVVLQTRGVSYRAAVVPEAATPMLAAGSLYVLSPDVSRLSPEYLVFFLNLPGTQALLRQSATGSTIPNLRRAAVEQLEVPLPALSDQLRLVELGRLVRKLSDIEDRLGLLRLHELQALTVARARDVARAPSETKKRG